MNEPFQLEQNPSGQLVLRRDGEAIIDVRLRRSFPWTRPDDLISIRNADGKEVGLIERLADLPGEQRALVNQWLADASFVPTIERVESINMDFGYQLWTVRTDRGDTTFRVQEREDVRFLPDGRFNVKDVEGNVYAMPRLDAMDEVSQRVLAAIV